MELFIRIKNGQPFEHPIMGDNFREALPHIDVNNLPPEFAKFERIKMPILGTYEVYEGVTYGWDGNIVKDVHNVRVMTDEEKIEKQNRIKQQWSTDGFASWIFDEDICAFIAPIAYPQDGKLYGWNENQLDWVLANNQIVELPPQ